MNRTPLRVAVVGHTNTGKTSLLRTLTRDDAFGEVSDRPATTRDVRGVALLAGDETIVELFDTPGLEDAPGVAQTLAQQPPDPDPVAAIERFLAGDHGHGRYEQEAKVLRQLLRSDAALYVIDAREPVRNKHREELRLLAACGRPVLPVLNFLDSAEADTAAWKTQLARLGLHLSADFDTVVYDAQAERQLFDKLAALVEPRRADLERLQRDRAQMRAHTIESACRLVAGLLADAGGARVRGAPDAPPEALATRLQDRVRQAEQRCVDALLGLFRFDMGAHAPPALPLHDGRWALDPFDPEALRRYGIRTGSAAAAGGMAGLAVDSMTGFASLGAAAAIGAGLGAAWSTARTFGQPWLDRARGYQALALDEATLALLAGRQLQLLRALLRRGHASTAPLAPNDGGNGWPSAAVRRATLRLRAMPECSSLNEVDGSAHAAPPLAPLTDALLAVVNASPMSSQPRSVSS
ncbi:MAG TPA: DUF3482 domain-containing protein [Solimonas sp.]